MCPIDVPNLDEIHTRGLDAAGGALPEDDTSPTSDLFKRLRVVAGLSLQINHHLTIVADDVLPDTADGLQLDRHGFIYGVARKLATPARKADSLRLVGTVASGFVIGDELVSLGGLRFQVNENGSIPAAEFIDVDCIAIDTGSQTKLLAGEVLTFVAPPAGIEAEAELQLDLDEDGTDQESDGAYRVRILNRIQQPGMGGNANDYEQFALEEQGIESAFVYPERAGKGSVDLAALHAGSGTIRPLAALERDDLETAIDAKRPVAVSFRVLETTTLAQDVELTVEPTTDPQFRFDWEDDTPLEVLTWTAATRTLQFDTDRPTDMQKGDRIVIKTTAGDGTGEEFEIERFGAGLDEVVLEKAPVPAPVATDTVFSGGPLVTPTRLAILEFINELGPAIGLFGVGNWEDSIDPRRMENLALDVEGVRRATTIEPATTVTPTDPAFPNDDSVELLIPGRVIVRSA